MDKISKKGIFYRHNPFLYSLKREYLYGEIKGFYNEEKAIFTLLVWSQ